MRAWGKQLSTLWLDSRQEAVLSVFKLFQKAVIATVSGGGDDALARLNSGTEARRDEQGEAQKYQD